MSKRTVEFDIKTHCIEGQHKRGYRQGAVSDNAVTYIQVKQYVPTDNPSQKGGTIIAAGGNGFPKEAYEPFFEDLYLKMRQHGQEVRGFWIADFYTQGGSALENSSSRGNDPNWLDHSRDMLHMINVFRNEMQEPLIGIGHSVGAAQMAYLSTLHPRLFTTLVLIEPQINDGIESAAILPLWQAVGRRRETWPSRVEAEKALRKSPFYAKWNSRAVDRLVEASFTDDVDSTRTSTPRDMEVAMMGRLNLDRVGLSESKKVEVTAAVPDLDPSARDTYPLYRPEPVAVLRILPILRPSVLWICSEKSMSSRKEFRDQWLNLTGTGVGGSGGAAADRVSMHVFPGDNHTLPMDDRLPEVVSLADSWIAKETDRWREQEAEFQKTWEEKTLSEKQALHPVLHTIVRDYRGKEPLESFVRKLSGTPKL